MPEPTCHVPVLPREILHWLDPRPGQVLVDGTLGGGGHTRLLAERVGPNDQSSRHTPCAVTGHVNESLRDSHSRLGETRPRAATGRVISLDRDPAALAAAEAALAGLPVTLVDSNFCDLPEVLEQIEVAAVDGILLDLGLSSDQLADAQRGFSFSTDGPLDLRFDPREGEPAWRLVNKLHEENLANLIYAYGEDRHSRRIARAIVHERHQRPIMTAAHLAEVVRRAIPKSPRQRGERIDPATRAFQALRIAVNDELKSLEIALRRLPDCLRSGGRLAIISFHSLEDRRVKEAFRDDDRLKALTRRPVEAGDEELSRNPRARSAKLRIAERR